ncbi:MAG: hypothetical protein ACO326_09275, partial [Burkholderiaceae bacterium]
LPLITRPHIYPHFLALSHVPKCKPSNRRASKYYGPGQATVPLLSVAQAQLLATQWLWSYNNDQPNTAIGGVPPR